MPGLLESTPYRVLHEIGRGGMAVVYEAEHRLLGKRVVVKILHGEYAGHDRAAERFRREAKVLAQLSSPFVVGVLDFGQTPTGAEYLVMERLHGHTLRQEMKERGGFLSLREAIGWTRQVLAGLAAVHRVGIVHRDVKLDNVFLCDATEHEERRVKLLDFGIVKIVSGAPGIPAVTRHQLTAEGAVLGSPRWLAPEQARGIAVDHRADVYATGILLYTLLCGRGPFAHIKDTIAAIEAHLCEMPKPPSSYATGQNVPRELDEIVLTAMAKRPEDRFQTAEAFAAALEALAIRLGDVTQPLPGAQSPPPSPSGLGLPTSTAGRTPLPPMVSELLASAGVDESTDSNAPTLVRGMPRSSAGTAPPALVEPGARRMDLSFDEPTVQQRPAPPSPGLSPPVAAAPVVARGTIATGERAAGRRSASIFVGLMAASALLFLVLVALVLHLFGVRLVLPQGAHAATLRLSSPEAGRGALRVELPPGGRLFLLEATRPRWQGPEPQRSTFDPRRGREVRHGRAG